MSKRGREKGRSTTEITPKQKRAVDLFRDKNNPETFGHKTNSYIAAGYKTKSRNTAASAAVQMFQSETVVKYMQRIDEEEKQSLNKSKQTLNITAEKARNDLLEYLEACKSKEDLTNWGAAIRLQLQVTGQLSEKVVHTIEDSRKLNESHRRQAQRIASIINKERMLGAGGGAADGVSQACLPAIDAQFVEQDGTQDVVGGGDTSDNV